MSFSFRGQVRTEHEAARWVCERWRTANEQVDATRRHDRQIERRHTLIGSNAACGTSTGSR